MWTFTRGSPNSPQGPPPGVGSADYFPLACEKAPEVCSTTSLPFAGSGLELSLPCLNNSRFWLRAVMVLLLVFLELILLLRDCGLRDEWSEGGWLPSLDLRGE